MVFISFPSTTTSEEEALLKKYEKLERKKKLLEQACKPKPEVVAMASEKPKEAKDARKVIETLKRTGQLPIITAGKKSEFKRKVPQNPIIKLRKPDEESRKVVSYDDDLFD